MFEYLLQGNGIVVGEMNTTLRKQIIAIIDYTNSLEAAPSLIVAEDAYSVPLEETNPALPSPAREAEYCHSRVLQRKGTLLCQPIQLHLYREC